MGDVGGFDGEGENGGAIAEVQEQGEIEGGFGVLSMIRFGSRPNPDPLAITKECLGAAEEAAQEVLNCIHPTLDSEEKRKDVIDYIQRLIRDYLGCEVFPYGSVPLKTYLPDGDIDLTVIHTPQIEDYLPKEVLAVLQEEERNVNAEYQVKDAHFVDAKVKLVKCLVQDTVIDISVNQLGGLCTLCFLEQVDRLAGKDHLFKRSILLIKSWCYYESRILGAHHGLISTYALETLVLYILHLFHSSLSGPLAVLYKFLDYYSRFDWDNYCISLNGPVRKSNLPDIVVEKPDNGGNTLLLCEEFLRNSIDMFSMPANDQTSKAFPQKHLNIIDPLKEYNNLGNSVHRANFYRIRSAFKYGARKLGQILSLPKDKVAEEIKSFFSNTLERHGRKSGHCMHKRLLVSGAEGSINLSCSSPADMLFEDDMLLRSALCDFEDGNAGLEDKCTSLLSDELGKSSKVIVTSQVAPETYSSDGASVSRNFCGDANGDFYCSSSHCADGTSDCPSHHSLSLFHASQLCSLTSTISKDLKFGSSCQTVSSDGFDSNTYGYCADKLEEIYEKDSVISSPRTDILDSSSLDFRFRDISSMASDVEPFNPLTDLTGDYDSHIRSYLYGQSFHGLSLSAPIISYYPSSPSGFQRENPWDTVCQSIPIRWNSFPQNRTNFVYTGSSLNVAASPASSVASFNNEDISNARGTGPYFPKKEFCRWERSFHGGKVRSKASGGCCQFQRNTRRNGLDSGLAKTSYFENSSNEDPHSQSSVYRKTVGADTRVNGSLNSSCRLQFGSLGSPPIVLSESSRSSCANPSLSLQIRSTESALDKKQERVKELPFHLKNDDEFPALTA